MNKLAPWSKNYRHLEDCKMEGCPGHTCTFTYHSVTDSFTFDFGDGSGIEPITIDIIQLELIKRYLKDLEL